MAKPIADVVYWIKDPAVTVTITPFKDITTNEYGNRVRYPSDYSTGDNLCGPKLYHLYESFPDRFNATLHDPNGDFPWISMTYSAPNYTLSIQTNDPKYYMEAYKTF